MNDVDIEKLKELVDSQERETARIEGKLESLKEQIKELGFSGLISAKKYVRTQIPISRKKKNELKRRMYKFGKKYAKHLE